MITKAERTELKSVVRQQMRVLRAEIEQRRAELHADIEQQITDRFADEDRTWANVQHEVHEAVLEANRRINDALRDNGYEVRGATERMWVTEPTMRQPREKRVELRGQAVKAVEAQVKAALLSLERQEADLLRSLAVGAIESSEAHEFLNAIPTVGELVPAARIAELEASLNDDEEGGGA